MSKIDSNNLHLSDDQIRDLIIHYASLGRLLAFTELYMKICGVVSRDEAARCYFFIRLALKLPQDDYGNY